MAPPSPRSKKPKNVSYSSMELVLHSSDLLREILLRLPAKSLVKLQSVCKQWLSLISSAEFRQQHTISGLKLQQQSVIIHTCGIRKQWFHLNPSSRRMTSLIPNLPDDPHNKLLHTILQSSNGLLLLQIWYLKNHYCVHNPATKQSRKIIPPHSSTHPFIAKVALAFDPSKSPYYELVCIRRPSFVLEDGGTYLIEVYNSKSHTWNHKELLTVEQSTQMIHLEPVGVRVYWNNAIYIVSNRDCIRYHIAKGEWKTLPFPNYNAYRNLVTYSHLQVSNGHLFHVELMGSKGGREWVALRELVGDDDPRWLLRHHRVLPPPPPRVAKWKPPSINVTFMADTCSLLICRDDWMRVYRFNIGSYEDLLGSYENCWAYEGFQFEGTLALV